jgi:hypothetical protein
VQWRGKLTGKQAITAAEPDEPHHHKPVLEEERILMVYLVTSRAQAKGGSPAISHKGGAPHLCQG